LLWSAYVNAFHVKIIGDDIREWKGESYLKTLSSARVIL